MIARRSIYLLLALLLQLHPTSAAVQSARPGSDSANDSPASNSIEQEIHAFKGAAFSIQEATKIVEEHLAGAKVVDLSFDGQGAVPYFNVKACHGDNIWDVVIDTSTRQIIRANILMPISQLDAEEKTRIAEFKRSRIDLSDAIAVAEQYGFGSAISAGLDRVDGRLIFRVVVVSGSELKDISIDPNKEAGGPRRSAKAASRHPGGI